MLQLIFYMFKCSWCTPQFNVRLYNVHIKEEDMKNSADDREVDMKVEAEEERDEAAAAEKEKR